MYFSEGLRSLLGEILSPKTCVTATTRPLRGHPSGPCLCDFHPSFRRSRISCGHLQSTSFIWHGWCQSHAVQFHMSRSPAWSRQRTRRGTLLSAEARSTCTGAPFGWADLLRLSEEQIANLPLRNSYRFLFSSLLEEQLHHCFQQQLLPAASVPLWKPLRDLRDASSLADGQADSHWHFSSPSISSQTRTASLGSSRATPTVS